MTKSTGEQLKAAVIKAADELYDAHEKEYRLKMMNTPRDRGAAKAAFIELEVSKAEVLRARQKLLEAENEYKYGYEK